jgi:hypothetical protein
MQITNAAAGANRLHFDASGLSSGVYFARLHAAGQTAMKKVVLVK